MPSADMDELPRLNRNTHVPLYYQLKKVLRGQIRNNTYKERQMLPSENELIEMYGVSRYVARQALNELEREGLIVSRRGVGSFVNARRYTKQLSIMGSFTHSLAAVSDTATVRIVSREAIVPAEHILDALDLPANSQTVVVERVGSIEGEPIAVTKAYFPIEIGRVFLTEDLGNKSLYQLLETRLNTEPHRAEWILSVVPASPQQAQLLDIREGSPLICNRGTTFTAQGAPIEYSELCYRSDRVEFSITGFRRNDASADM